VTCVSIIEIQVISGMTRMKKFGKKRISPSSNGLKELSDAGNVLTFQMRNWSVRIFKDWFVETTL
jgi:hypothetical protein